MTKTNDCRYFLGSESVSLTVVVPCAYPFAKSVQPVGKVCSAVCTAYTRIYIQRCCSVRLAARIWAELEQRIERYEVVSPSWKSAAAIIEPGARVVTADLQKIDLPHLGC